MLFRVLFLLLFPFSTMACTLSYTSPSDDIRSAMAAGFDWHTGWTLKSYESVCARLAKNNAQLSITGMMWQHEPGNYILSYGIGIADNGSALTNNDFMRSGILTRDGYNSRQKVYVELFDEINKDIDYWVSSGVFDQAVKEFHRKKIILRGG